MRRSMKDEEWEAGGRGSGVVIRQRLYVYQRLRDREYV